MISFGVIGASVRSGNLALLSALTIPEDRRQAELARLKDVCGFSELVAVFTCNRVEFYYETDGQPPGTAHRNKLLDFFFRGRSDITFEPSDIYSHSAFRALKHLYRVAGSLDSMVVGEAQILGQVKKAWSDAREMNLGGPHLDAIFTEAFRVAKKVRRETPLGQHSVSMVSLVMDATVAHLEACGPAAVAIVGVGPMSLKLAEHLHTREDVELVFVNRTVAKAEPIATRYGGRVLSLDDFVSAPPPVDIVFTSTGAPQTILNLRAIESLQQVRRGKTPLLLIDLAIPRDVDPAAAEVDGVKVCDIPYFQSMADRNRRARFVAVDQAEQIVDIEIGRAHRRNAERQFRPVFASALNEGLAYAQAGLEKLFETRLPHLGEADRKAIRHWMDKLVRYTNHLPMTALAEQADTSHGNCAMIHGFGCVQTRADDVVRSEDPVAQRCARKEGKHCVMDAKHSFHVR